LFDPFITTKSTGSDRKKRGIGLGLSIVKRIIDGHNGSITVSSVESSGTTFLVGLPIAKAEV
jgi:signal transduction histidine kinase